MSSDLAKRLNALLDRTGVERQFQNAFIASFAHSHRDAICDGLAAIDENAQLKIDMDHMVKCAHACDEADAEVKRLRAALSKIECVVVANEPVEYTHDNYDLAKVLLSVRDVARAALKQEPPSDN